MAKKRNYKREYERYQSRPDQIKKREERNKARYNMMKEGKVRKGDGKDVDHTHPLAKGGSNNPSNWRVLSRHANRSFKRTRKARMA